MSPMQATLAYPRAVGPQGARSPSRRSGDSAWTRRDPAAPRSATLHRVAGGHYLICCSDGGAALQGAKGWEGSGTAPAGQTW